MTKNISVKDLADTFGILLEFRIVFAYFTIRPLRVTGSGKYQLYKDSAASHRIIQRVGLVANAFDFMNEAIHSKISFCELFSELQRDFRISFRA